MIIEQMANFKRNQAPGTGLSPDKMLLASGFSYADAHRVASESTTSRSPATGDRIEVAVAVRDDSLPGR